MSRFVLQKLLLFMRRLFSFVSSQQLEEVISEHAYSCISVNSATKLHGVTYCSAVQSRQRLGRFFLTEI